MNSSGESYHISVLKDEVHIHLQVRAGYKYIDGTIGGGGHTRQILESGGIVLGLDQDEDAILHLKKKFESEVKSKQLILARGNFADIEKIASENNFTKADGILFDLGLSSHQIDASGRGFSFMREEALDMRMDENLDLTAADIVNRSSEDELYEIFSKYGEEVRAREVARRIVSVRAKKRLETTRDLAEIISETIGSGGKINPSTRIFQALRIAVNSEIKNLNIGISEGFKLLNKGARFIVISFHSLEDRAVKLRFIEFEASGEGRILTKKPITPSLAEIRMNRRSRSAKMRVLEKN